MKMAVIVMTRFHVMVKEITTIMQMKIVLFQKIIIENKS